VTLRSKNPLDAPAIDPNFLSDPYDWELSIEGLKRGREILNASSFKPLIKREHMPSTDVSTDKGKRPPRTIRRRPSTRRCDLWRRGGERCPFST
jgi:choline dehydrogenase-like flavoprotein